MARSPSNMVRKMGGISGALSGLLIGVLAKSKLGFTQDPTNHASSPNLSPSNSVFVLCASNLSSLLSVATKSTSAQYLQTTDRMALD